MNEPETVDLLIALLQQQEPFLHVRFGDGDIMFMSGTGSVITGDGEEWSRQLQTKLLVAWMEIARYEYGPLLLGDVETYAVSDDCEKQWWMLRTVFDMLRSPVAEPPCLVNMEALRVGFGYAAPFYEAVRADKREKLLIGSPALEPLSHKLGCWHYEIPLRTAHQRAHEFAADIARLRPRIQVALFAAGRAGKIMQALLSQQAHLTQIDIGSGLDLLVPDGVRRGTDLKVNREGVLAEYRELGWAV